MIRRFRTGSSAAPAVQVKRGAGVRGRTTYPARGAAIRCRCHGRRARPDQRGSARRRSTFRIRTDSEPAQPSGAGDYRLIVASMAGRRAGRERSHLVCVVLDAALSSLCVIGRVYGSCSGGLEFFGGVRGGFARRFGLVRLPRSAVRACGASLGPQVVLAGP